MARAVLLVMDSLGVGAAPDAAGFGDAGADTLGHIADYCARPLEQGGRGVVVLPFIGNPALTSRLLLPVSSERQARVLETDAELELAGASVRCRRCEYLGDQYGPGTEFWLAEDKLLLRYQWRQSPQQHWDIWLQRDCGSE